MNNMNAIILIQLLLAHILTDFVFQTKKCVEKKREKGVNSFSFILHVLLSGALTYILLQQWTNWQIPLFIIITHFCIDWWKIKQEQKTKYFFIDQALHLVAILFAWLYIIHGFNTIVPFIHKLFTDLKPITIITALILLIWPTGITIGMSTESFRKQISSEDSLEKAGMYIGIFERLLVFIFIMISQYAAIGFLLAAKSILRVGKDNDKEARKKTEYVLVGTLISFTVAILFGLLTKYIIKINL